MKEKEVLENNKLIAKFMEFPINSKQVMYDTRIYYDISKLNLYNMVSMACEDQFSFHKSWDWLMPIVEKIESFIFNKPESDTYYNVQILGGCYVMIISNNGDELITSDSGQSKLECTYLAVVEFIKWYNETK